MLHFTIIKEHWWILSDRLHTGLSNILYVSEPSEYWTVLNLPASQDTHIHIQWIPAYLVMSSSSGPCHLISLILLITCCVCSKKEDSATISDMDLDCSLQKCKIEIFTEQSPPLSLDKMYPFPQILANSLYNAEEMKSAAHLIRD